MLREIYLLVPALISKSINKVVHSTNYESKEKSFKRFSIFWKLTMGSAKDSQDPAFEEINKLGLFMMIEFLDDENPLLRHASKNWMVDSISFFEKILDPLIEDMVKYTCFYVSEGGQFFFSEVYDTRKVFSRFKKLKNILLSITELFSSFLLNKQLTPRVKLCKLGLLEDDLLSEARSPNYFDLLIVISIRYIQGQALESLSPSFAKENEKVNSVACEFFDLLVTCIPQKALEIAKYVYRPLLVVQRYAVTNNNFIMQVQLLSLLKFVIFGKNTLNSAEKQGELLAILNSPMLMPKIIQGLQSRSPYVLIQYVNFINHAMPTLASVLPAENLEKLITQILDTYRALIDRYSNPGHQEDAGVVIHENKVGEKNIANLSSKAGQLFESTGMQMQSNIMELIGVLIEGIYFIFNFFLNIENAEAESLAQNENGSERRIIKFLTLGVMGRSSKKNDSEELQHFEIAKVVACQPEHRAQPAQNHQSLHQLLDQLRAVQQTLPDAYSRSWRLQLRPLPRVQQRGRRRRLHTHPHRQNLDPQNRQVHVPQVQRGLHGHLRRSLLRGGQVRRVPSELQQAASPVQVRSFA